MHCMAPEDSAVAGALLVAVVQIAAAGGRCKAAEAAVARVSSVEGRDL